MQSKIAKYKYLNIDKISTKLYNKLYYKQKYQWIISGKLSSWYL